MTQELADLVRRRAEFVCEYCLLPQSIHGWVFEIDHIIAEQHGGKTEAANLSLCCPRCNRRKGPNVAGVDPESGNIIPLFNPRLDRWSDHFSWNESEIVGRTPPGRATIVVLAMNDSIRIAVRTVLIDEGIFPPK